MKKEKKRLVTVRFVFEGHALIKANSRQEAEATAARNITARLGEVASSCDKIADWEFPIHGETKVRRKKTQQHE